MGLQSPGSWSIRSRSLPTAPRSPERLSSSPSSLLSLRLCLRRPGWHHLCCRPRKGSPLGDGLPYRVIFPILYGEIVVSLQGTGHRIRKGRNSSGRAARQSRGRSGLALLLRYRMPFRGVPTKQILSRARTFISKFSSRTAPTICAGSPSSSRPVLRSCSSTAEREVPILG